MLPTDFIERLHRHYSKRHASEAELAKWLEEMVDLVKGTEPRLLQRTYDMIRDEYEERAFPLPATIKRFVHQAGEAMHLQSQAHQYKGRSCRAPDTPAYRDMIRQAQEWQAETIAKYGSWAGYNRATAHMPIVKGERAPRFAQPMPELQHIRHAKIRPRRIRQRGVDTSRIIFEALQRRSANRLHRERRV